MQLTVRDVARTLNVTEKTVHRWIREGSIPASKVNDQYRFNRAELLEWATSRNLSVSAELFQEADADAAMPALGDALERGGVFYDLSGADKASALRSVVEHIRFPEPTDRELFLRVLLAREELGSTGIGEGIAIPHVRTPVVLHVDQPLITLCFLKQPVDFGALDGKPVHALFTLISPTVRTHLHLISRLAFALRDSDFSAAVLRHASQEDILQQMHRVEAGLGK